MAFVSDASGADGFRWIRELGSRAVPTWAALDARAVGRSALVVVERVGRGGGHGEDDVDAWVRDARHVRRLEHPNVAKVRDVVVGPDEVFVVGEFVDGVRWSELAAAALPPTLETTLRVFIDVLAGLSALHNLRDENRRSLGLMHGELTPECIVVGWDGVTRIVSPCRLRSATARPGRAGSAYLAPEILLADDSAEARADVYSIGVMLWEALSGRALFPNTQPAAVVTHLLSGRIPDAKIPDGCPWAQPLVEVVKRTLAVEPDRRFESAAALAAELRRVVGPRLATPARTAAFVRAVFGDVIRGRREALERGLTDGERPESGVGLGPFPAPIPADAPAHEPSLPDVRTLPAPGVLTLPAQAVPDDMRVTGEGLAIDEARATKRRRRAIAPPLALGLALAVGAGLWWASARKIGPHTTARRDDTLAMRAAPTPTRTPFAAAAVSADAPKGQQPPLPHSSDAPAAAVNPAPRPLLSPAWPAPPRPAPNVPAANIHYQPEGI
jgi:serine/threonine-protein kinase